MQPPPQPDNNVESHPGLAARVVALAAGLFPALMVFLQVTGFNGPYYWRWHYGHDSIVPYLLLAVPAGGLIFRAQRKFASSRGMAIGLLLLAQLFLLFTYIGLSEHSYDSIKWRIRNPNTTSYYTVALSLHDLRHWIAHYSEALPQMPGHAQTHPPGPILYFYAWLKFFHDPAAAMWAGVSIGVLASLGIPGIYLLTRRISGDPEAGLSAATFWSMLPGIIVMLPSLDQVYPVFAIALLYFWRRCAIEGELRYAAMFAVALFGGLLFSHSFLVLGVFFLLSALLAPDRRRASTAGAVSFLLVCGLFAAAYALTGYNHAAALRQSMRLQANIAQILRRPYQLAIFWDLYDFFLASGWISAGILALAAWRLLVGRPPWAAAGPLAGLVRFWQIDGPGPDAGRGLGRPPRQYAVAALATVLLVDLSGLLRTEAARVWLFLQPLVIPLLGMELRSWNRNWRLAAYGTLLFVLVVIRCRMHFL